MVELGVFECKRCGTVYPLAIDTIKVGLCEECFKEGSKDEV